MKKAFTVAESIIVVIVISMLLIFMLNAFKNTIHKEKVLFKKAYSAAEQAIGELVNDERVYRYTQSRIGFRNTEKACILGLSKEECNACDPISSDNCFEDEQKFGKLFARKLNVVGDIINNTDNIEFTTNDGIKWVINAPFSSSAPLAGASDYGIIMVDINGDNEPNIPKMEGCNIPFFRVATIRGATKQDTILNIENFPQDDENRDRFFIIVDYDGAVRVPHDSLEARYLNSTDSRRDR